MILDALAVPFALGGFFSAASAISSSGPYRQILRRETVPVRALAPGPVEVAGTLRATEQPLEALDGLPATATRTIVSYDYRSEGKTCRRNAAVDELIAVDAEIVDETGSCALDTASVVLLGVSRSFTYTPEKFAERCPALCKSIGEPEIVEVTVEQSYLPDGASGVASGEAEAIEDAIEPGEGYRGERRRRFRLTATAERPLILSAFPEAATRRLLLGPARLFGVLACAWFGVAGALLAAARLIGG